MARIAWLEEQRRDRSAVVQLLAHIGHSVPRDVWLTALSREEEMVSMVGLSVTHRAVAEFLANLESGGLFVGPVDLIDSGLRLAPAADADAGQGLIEFSIRARLASTDGDTPPASGHRLADPTRTSAEAHEGRRR
jgi:hypothetical protein